MALKTNTTFPRVDMSMNKVDAEGAKEVGAMLSSNNTLRDLNLSENELTNDGVGALAEGLQCNTSLRSLELGMVSIGLQGARHIAELLSSNSTLTRLVLSGNDKIGARGVESIASALGTNQGLGFLEMANVGCDNSSAEALLEALANNKTLTELKLKGNRVNEATIDRLKDILEANYGTWFEKEREAAAKRQMELNRRKEEALKAQLSRKYKDASEDPTAESRPTEKLAEPETKAPSQSPSAGAAKPKGKPKPKPKLK
eukprot:NODE_1956_length_1026_cov_88.903787_g1588_i0.p1 GENE.NODE_1956_length_1026_cov_88.903787_g1588_i0~~NODE_1956_length_1026_cov_88.903787_g1588_i0.p1  ORF type:complete len:297 (+),score=126.25 NODE_1956_length_1026_cov_88.903787_g1588_i0:119-892(+)